MLIRDNWLLIFLKLMYTLFFYKQLHLPSKPGIAKEICENEAESCLGQKEKFCGSTNPTDPSFFFPQTADPKLFFSYFSNLR